MTEPKRKGIMLCYPFEEKRLAKWGDLYIVQPKLDGDRCRLIVTQDKRCLLLSSSEEIITSVPHINQLAPHTMPPGEWDGELYVHGWSWEDIHSVVSRTVNLHPDYEQMQFHCFDHIHDRPQAERILRLQDLNQTLRENPLFHVVPSYLARSVEDVYLARDAFVAQGYEGFIVRHPGASYQRKRFVGIMKFKPKKRDAYLITGFLEEHDKYGNPKGQLGRFICRGDDGTEFTVYSGITEHQRKYFWSIRDTLPGQFLMVGYQNLTHANGVPRSGCFVNLIGHDEAAEIEPGRNLR